MQMGGQGMPASTAPPACMLCRGPSRRPPRPAPLTSSKGPMTALNSRKAPQRGLLAGGEAKGGEEGGAGAHQREEQQLHQRHRLVRRQQLGHVPQLPAGGGGRGRRTQSSQGWTSVELAGGRQPYVIGTAWGQERSCRQRPSQPRTFRQALSPVPQLVRQHSHHLLAAALLYQRVVQDDALVGAKAVLRCVGGWGGGGATGGSLFGGRHGECHAGCVRARLCGAHPAEKHTHTAALAPAPCVQLAWPPCHTRTHTYTRAHTHTHSNTLATPSTRTMYALECAERVEPSMTNSFLRGKASEAASSSIPSRSGPASSGWKVLNSGAMRVGYAVTAKRERGQEEGPQVEPHVGRAALQDVREARHHRRQQQAAQQRLRGRGGAGQGPGAALSAAGCTRGGLAGRGPGCWRWLAGC